MKSAVSRKRILLVEPRGYCAGVDRAVTAVEKALEKFGSPIYVRKEIVHNKYVVDDLQQKGVIFVEEVEEVPRGSLLIFSAHGVSPEVKQRALQRNLITIDATCPLVTKVHQEAKKFAKQDYEILLIGHDGHEEVEGTAGEAPSQVHLVDGEDSISDIKVKDPEKVVWLSQTTLSVDETYETVDKLKTRFPNLLDPPSDDICYATQNRQAAVKTIAPECDLVLVVGSQNSSNSKRLAEVAKQAGAKKSFLIDYATEIDRSWLEGVETIGLTSGASVPDLLVQEVIDYLQNFEFDEVELVKTREETLSFALPNQLRERRDKKKI